MLKLKALAAAVLVSMSAGAFAGTTSTTALSLTPGGLPGSTFSALSGTADENIFTFNLAHTSLVQSFLSAFSLTSPTGSSGYDITSVSFDSKQVFGFSFGIPGLYTSDTYNYAGDLLNAGSHTITVKGSYAGSGSGFSGFVAFVPTAPVPEPENYALFLAGLGLMGAIAKRRASKNA